MALSRLIYASLATSPFSEDQLTALAQKAAMTNAKLGISGVLVYCDGQFMQLLEGEGSSVRPLYEKISLDRRHRDVRLVTLDLIPSRSFSDWGMSFLHENRIDSLDRTRIKKLLASVSQASLAGVATSAVSLLEDLKAAIGESTNGTRKRASV